MLRSWHQFERKQSCCLVVLWLLVDVLWLLVVSPSSKVLNINDCLSSVGIKHFPEKALHIHRSTILMLTTISILILILVCVIRNEFHDFSQVLGILSRHPSFASSNVCACAHALSIFGTQPETALLEALLVFNESRFATVHHPISQTHHQQISSEKLELLSVRTVLLESLEIGKSILQFVDKTSDTVRVVSMAFLVDNIFIEVN
jgi:hypothetical protein